MNPESLVELEKLFEITRDVLDAPTLDAALTSIARGVQEVFGWRMVSLVAMDEPGSGLRRRVMLGYPRELVTVRLGEQIDRDAFSAMLQNAVPLFDDCYFFPAERSPNWERLIFTGQNPDKSIRAFPTQWLEHDGLALTLHDRDGTMIGYMSPDGPRNGEIPSPQTLRVMRIFVNIMGMALANARSQSRLQYEATHDALTGLPNRTVFALQLARALADVHRENSQQFAVLYLDLDELKSINDSLGHIGGDHLLKETAHRLRMVVDEEHLLARMAGDEFAILLRNATPQNIARRIDVVHETLRRPYVISGSSINLTASIGIAAVLPNYNSIEDVLRDADTAMYRAKDEGKNRSATFEPSMREEALERLALRWSLRTAIDEKQFTVYYQPIVSLQTGKIHAAEALLRWEHPEQGHLAPAFFLPLAEEMGLMVPVGRFVLETACRHLAEWELGGNGAIEMNVNLAAQEVLQPDLAEYVNRLVQSYGIEPSRLCLEITETSLLQSEGRAEKEISQLRATGVQICIDDFGTGYSSLRYVASLPIDGFKIDQTFIAQLPERKSTQIVQFLIRLGDGCGLRVTAEGIETKEQAELLASLGCKFGQGDSFFAPMTYAEITKTLSQSR